MDMEPEPKPFATAQQGRPVYGLPLAPPRRRSRLLLVGLPVLAVFTAFAAVVWLAHSGGAGGSPIGEPPLIRAATTPIKLSPDQAGGSEVAEQGEIRQLLGDLPFEQQLERLLPPPEEPLPAPEDLLASDEQAAPPAGSGQAGEESGAPAQTAALDPSSADPAGQATPPDAQTAPDEPEATPAGPSAPVAEPSPPRPSTSAEGSGTAPGEPAAPSDPSADAALDALIAEVTREPLAQPDQGTQQGQGAQPSAEAAPRDEPPSDSPRQSPSESTSAPATPREPQVAAVTPDRPVDGDARSDRQPVLTTQDQAASDPGYRVQLAAVREQADARRAWDLFMLDLGPILSRYQPYFERADTENGIFYRVQIGTFASADTAESVCNDLKQRNASCFVVRR